MKNNYYCIPHPRIAHYIKYMFDIECQRYNDDIDEIYITKRIKK